MKQINRPPFQITLYSRQGCHLCDDVEQAIRSISHDIPLELTVVPINSDLALEEKYMFTIPVVHIDGEEVFVSVTSVVTEEELREELGRRI
ncbi:glutaredoxin family protein [Brevibacillus dissolubilis]|uniref:glutaredoxin family protein n=1 Tax=Brevibacillus dissolubilis TaxID=1844116 RepID=UPI001115CD20|nr:glutaredoxin family protein [Brevibacillus dissolubilis]